jgi:hypothetical protein
MPIRRAIGRVAAPLAIAVAFAVWLASCANQRAATGPGQGSAGSDTSLVRVSGDSQSATMAAVLTNPLVVRVADAGGHPLPGVAVTWQSTQGSGSVTPVSPVTDATGHASALWTIDGTFTDNSLTAAAGSQHVVFSAFGTGSGDLGGRRIFPADNAWNADISGQAVDPRSDTLIAHCGGTSPLHPDFGTVYAGAPNGIPYVVVHGTQPGVPVSFQYSGESDPGPYPIPPYAPIEGGAASTGDRHVLVLDIDHWRLYELFAAYPVGGGASWTGGSGAVFDLSSDSLRPAGWTSADAAGLPILPGLVRYDEVVLHGAITHALRFTCPRTRRAYVFPARHFASSDTSSDLPPMGMRVRLKSGVSRSGFSPNVRVILTALQRYGMLLADNGSPFYLSGAPDPRWSDDDLHTLTRLHGTDFEVVQMGTVVTH